MLKAAATKEQRRSSQTYAVGCAEGGKQMELQKALVEEVHAQGAVEIFGDGSGN